MGVFWVFVSPGGVEGCGAVGQGVVKGVGVMDFLLGDSLGTMISYA